MEVSPWGFKNPHILNCVPVSGVPGTICGIIGVITVVVKRQAEEVGKRAPDKLRAQKNLKLKTRAQLNKRAVKQIIKKALESKYG